MKRSKTYLKCVTVIGAKVNLLHVVQGSNADHMIGSPKMLLINKDEHNTASEFMTSSKISWLCRTEMLGKEARERHPVINLTALPFSQALTNSSVVKRKC